MISLFVVLFYSIHVPNWDDGRSFSGCYFTSRHNKMNWRNALEYNDRIKLKSLNYLMTTDDDNDEDDSALGNRTEKVLLKLRASWISTNIFCCENVLSVSV